MNAHLSNSLEGWQVDPELIASCGTDLRHPECVLTAADDALWISDARGIIYISGDRKTQRLIKQKSAIGTVAKVPADAEPSLPNGIAFGEHGELLVANIGTGALERTSPDGATRALYDEIEGQPIGKEIGRASCRERVCKYV